MTDPDLIGLFVEPLERWVSRLELRDALDEARSYDP